MNINDVVSVKLTERGLEIYEQHIKDWIRSAFHGD